MIYGYARVSSMGQAQYGTSLEEQARMLKEAGAQEIVSECYTGMALDRPLFSKLISGLKDGDTLMVAKLDRFARAIDASKIIQGLVARGVRVHILNMGMADATPIGKLMLNMILAFAEYERDVIFERTQAGKRVKRETDPAYREGRPRKEPAAFRAYAERNRRGEMSVAKCCEALCIGRSTWYNLLALSRG
jgi:DNA invertase Pin-like site-specific DNA recombinase